MRSTPAGQRIDREERRIREVTLRAQTAEITLAEALELIADLNAQLDLANAASVRMAQRLAAAGRRLAA